MLLLSHIIQPPLRISELPLHHLGQQMAAHRLDAASEASVNGFPGIQRLPPTTRVCLDPAAHHTCVPPSHYLPHALVHHVAHMCASSHNSRAEHSESETELRGPDTTPPAGNPGGETARVFRKCGSTGKEGVSRLPSVDADSTWEERLGRGRGLTRRSAWLSGRHSQTPPRLCSRNAGRLGLQKSPSQPAESRSICPCLQRRMPMEGDQGHFISA